MIVVKINNVDRSNQIIFTSLSVTDQLNQAVNNASFTMQRIAGDATKSYKPLLGSEVVMEDGATRVFGGIIVDLSETVSSGTEVRYDVKCKDYTQLLDGKLVVEKYENTTVNNIIQDIYHRYIVDWTLGNVSVGLPNTTDVYSFEYPVLAPNTYSLRPSASWGFTGRAGIASNGSAYGQPTAPDGTQVGLIQDDAGSGDGQGYMFKYFSPIISGYYIIAFKACKRAGYNDATLDIKINGVVKDSVTISNTAFKQYYSKPIYMTSGFSELGFLATGSNMTAFLDDINFSTPNAFSIQYVNCPIAVKTTVLNRISFSASLEKLSKLTGFSWAVDYYKNIYFFEKNTITAPFNLEDDNGKYIFESLELNKDITQLRNRVFIRGGESKGATRTETWSWDGTKKTFPLSNKYATAPTITVNGSPVTVGIDYLNDEASFNCLWSFQEKYIKFSTGFTATAGTNNILVTGEPLFPVQVQVEDPVSIAEYGLFEYSKKDLTIKSKEEALRIAQAELKAYSDTIDEGSFDTYESGLVSGQVIRIKSDIRALEEDFLIQKVVLRQLTTGKNIYKISLASLRTVGIIDLLISLLRSEDRYIDDSSDETIEKSAFSIEKIKIADAFIATASGILVGSEVIHFTDGFTNQGIDYPVEFALGDTELITFYNSNFEIAPSGTANCVGSPAFIDNTTTGSSTDKGYGWSMYSYSNGYAKIDSTEKHSGNYSLKLGTSGGGYVEASLPDRNSGGTGGYFNKTILQVLPNTSYMYTYYMKTNYSSGGGTGASLHFLEVKDDGTNAGQEVGGASVTTTTGWTKYTGTFTTTALTKFLQVSPRVYGHTGSANLTMEAWFDDISLEIINPSLGFKRAFILDGSPLA